MLWRHWWYTLLGGNCSTNGRVFCDFQISIYLFIATFKRQLLLLLFCFLFLLFVCFVTNGTINRVKNICVYFCCCCCCCTCFYSVPVGRPCCDASSVRFSFKCDSCDSRCVRIAFLQFVITEVVFVSILTSVNCGLLIVLFICTLSMAPEMSRMFWFCFSLNSTKPICVRACVCVRGRDGRFKSVGQPKQQEQQRQNGCVAFCCFCMIYDYTIP